MPELELDKWSNLYAQRMGVSKTSAVRDLMGAISRPDIISFAGGFPDTTIFEATVLKKISEKVLVDNSKQSLQYCSSDGFYPLKEKICELMRDDGIVVQPEEIIITVGAQQALELVTKIFVDPEDYLIIEEPSYVGALNSFHSFQAKFLTVPMDEQGLQTNKLEKLLKNKPENLKFLYTVPIFHNPAGITMSEERREHLLKIIQKHNLVVVEDNAYRKLYFYDPPPPSLRVANKEIIYLGSFSKIFSPGLRVGWIAAPAPIIARLNVARQSADLCPGTTTQHLVYEFLNTVSLDEHVARLKHVYRERCEAMLESMEKYFPPETSWTKPKGGFFVWATLPDYIDTGEMLADAISRGIAYVPGSGFYHDESVKNTMRLNFSYSPPEKIREGIKVLGKVIKEQMLLYRSLIPYKSKDKTLK